MASVRQTRTGKFELTVRSKLLPKGRVFLTFDDEEEAKRYGERCDKWLEQGLLPPGLVDEQGKAGTKLLGPILRGYSNSGEPSSTDLALLSLLFEEVGSDRLADFDYQWVERWVRLMKLERNFTPGTIRKRVQALAKAIDWHLRREPGTLTGNPLRLLPDGYSSYTEKDAQEATALGGEARVDLERDRRLAGPEEASVRQALAGVKRPDRERPLPADPHLAMLFDLLLGTGMRLREAYRPRRRQVDLQARVIQPQASKVWRGRVKYRSIPLVPWLHQRLAAYMAEFPGEPDDLLLPFWDGAEPLAKVTNRLSSRLATLFAYAGLEDFHGHDLRHEATCRWFEMRAPDGQWVFRTEEIHKIMGWSPGSRMALRYASFRAEDLANRMYHLPRAGQYELGRQAGLHFAPPQTDAAPGTIEFAEYMRGFADGAREAAAAAAPQAA